MVLDFEGDRYVNHYNKEVMRGYFTLLQAGQADGSYAATSVVDPVFLEIQQEKVSSIREYMLGRAEAARVKAELETAGLREITFYRDRGVLGGLKKINGVSE